MILSRPTGHQEVYLIDRKERFFEVQNLRFPHQDGEEYNHSNTIIDGELVIDIERNNSGLEIQVLRYLAFDCIVLDSESLMQRPLSSRYGRLKSWIIEPMVRYLRKHPHEQARMPFEVTLKPMELSYGIQKVLETHMPGLKHGNDGLIFTSAEAQYTIGTDRRILKWKPPSENSIDFRLELRFPALVHTRVEGSSRNGYGVEDVDWQAKPAFLLMMNAGEGSETFFDWLDMSDQEWEDWKSRGEQLDNRIVEVVWNASEQNWRIMRFRDDKREGNYESIVWKIIDSIKDGVEAQDLVLGADAIHRRWAERKAIRSGRPLPTNPSQTVQPTPNVQSQSQYQSQVQPAPPSQQQLRPPQLSNQSDLPQPLPPELSSFPPLSGFERPPLTLPPSRFEPIKPRTEASMKDYAHLLNGYSRQRGSAFDRSFQEKGRPLRLPFSDQQP